MSYPFWSEWELNEKVDFDGANKLIIVYPHVTELDIRADVWSAAVRWLGMLNRGYDRWLEPMERTGLDPIPGGETGDSYFLQNGWKLLVDFSKVKVTGVLFSRDYVTAYYTTDLVEQYAAQVSSIVNTVSGGGGTAEVDVDEIAAAVWASVSRTLTEQAGLSEADLHDGLDSYAGKDGYKATEVGLTASQSAQLDSIWAWVQNVNHKISDLRKRFIGRF